MNIQKKKELSHKINFMKQSFFNFTKTVENLNKIYQNTCGVLFYLSYLIPQNWDFVSVFLQIKKEVISYL